MDSGEIRSDRGSRKTGTGHSPPTEGLWGPRDTKTLTSKPQDVGGILRCLWRLLGTTPNDRPLRFSS